MLEIASVSKTFAKPLLEKASMQLPAGTGTVLVGPNGAGKSTLLKMITGLISPDSGEVLLMGKPPKQQAARLAYCPSTSAGFYRRLTARQNLHYFVSLYGLGRKQADRFISEQDFFGIDYWDQPTERLSDGMLQKVKLLRAFAHDPALAVLDEPLNYLDKQSKTLCLEWLRQWVKARPNRAFILTQHSLELPEPGWRIHERRLERVWS